MRDVGPLIPSLLILVGLVGIAVPILPGLLLVLAGVLLWAVMDGSTVAWLVFGVSVLVAVASYALKYLLPGRRMRERGVGGSTLALAVVFAVIGFFVVPVVGAVLGFVLGIFVVELGRGRDRAQAWERTKHALVAVAHSIGIELAAGLAIAGLYVGGLIAT